MNDNRTDIELVDEVMSSSGVWSNKRNAWNCLKAILNESGWINVDDQLPDHEKKPSDDVIYAVFEDNKLLHWGKGNVNMNGVWYRDGLMLRWVPTHWMKIPGLPEKEVIPEKKYIVRLYDGFDNEWIDICEPCSHEEAKKLYNKETENGTKKISYSDIDYYEIFDADTKMLHSSNIRG